MVAVEADYTLFVDNSETKVTEKWLFMLLCQGGPGIKVKIPKHKNDKHKQFFMNFKHEVSVLYVMNHLMESNFLEGTSKFNLRSSSSHAS